MKEINLPSGDYLLVEVPDDAYDFEIGEPFGNKVIWYQNSGSAIIPIPTNSIYQIISTTKDITEEICRNLIDDCDIYAKCWKRYTYKGPKDIGGKFNSDYSCWTAKESLNSLLQSVGLDLEKNYLILKKG